jgi:uncharacterized protein (TIGR03084 family)
MPDLGPLLDDLRAEQADLRALVGDADLDTPTPANPWDVRDAIAHLAGTDVEALKAATRPDQFVAELPELAKDIDGFLTGQLIARRGLRREELLADWQRGFDAMVQAFADVPPGTKVPWYGPPMSPASFATARLMEYWAHGQDVADGLGVERTPTDRLRHICHLGVRTRGFSYVNRGLPPPEVSVAVVVTAPSRDTWTFGDGEQRVTGPALDFCLLVTQRRHRDDLALVAEGAAADEWLDLAQCFAGPPGPGREPRR